jgi:hypothetical protein
MPGILLNWRRVAVTERNLIEQDSSRHVFWWDELAEESSVTRTGRSVFRRWSVYNSTNIVVGSRVFVIAQGGLSDGIMASDNIVEPPDGKVPVKAGSAVYLDKNWKTGETATANWNAKSAVLCSMLGTETTAPASLSAITGSRWRVYPLME